MIKELSDLGLVAGLLAKGYEYIDAYKQGRRVVFIFGWDDAMQELEDKYFSNDLEVDAQSYNSILRKVKTAIYNMIPEVYK